MKNVSTFFVEKPAGGGPSHGNRMNVDSGMIEVRSALREQLLRSNSE
jgi:hypothetical protein